MSSPSRGGSRQGRAGPSGEAEPRRYNLEELLQTEIDKDRGWRVLLEESEKRDGERKLDARVGLQPRELASNQQLLRTVGLGVATDPEIDVFRRRIVDNLQFRNETSRYISTTEDRLCRPGPTGRPNFVSHGDDYFIQEVAKARYLINRLQSLLRETEPQLRQPQQPARSRAPQTPAPAPAAAPSGQPLGDPNRRIGPESSPRGRLSSPRRGEGGNRPSAQAAAAGGASIPPQPARREQSGQAPLRARAQAAAAPTAAHPPTSHPAAHPPTATSAARLATAQSNESPRAGTTGCTPFQCFSGRNRKVERRRPPR